MLKKLSVKNFKSWADLPALEFGKVTALFGANSSGKTSLIQLLLMLKQTAASRDRRILNFGGTPQDYVDLGGYVDIVHGHDLESDLGFNLTWTSYYDEEEGSNAPWNVGEITLGVVLSYVGEQVVVKRLSYDAEVSDFGPASLNQEDGEWHSDVIYHSLNVSMERLPEGRYRIFLPPDVKVDSNIESLAFYNAAIPIYLGIKNAESLMLANSRLGDLSRPLEEFLSSIYYLGPLREYPHREYRWSGESPLSVGVRGEYAVPAMLSKLVTEQSSELIDSANAWLKRLGMAKRIDLRPIAQGARLYEFVVQTSGYKHDANLMDVGFGVSQVLPIIVLAHFAPPGSLIILEQPEIHLHPQVQTELADLFLETALERNVQFFIESHSEYLLMRLQRRLAERKGEFANLTEEDVRLYFCKREADASVLEPLAIDEFGRIKNWPKDFFGDAVAERRAMTEAMLERQSK